MFSFFLHFTLFVIQTVILLEFVTIKSNTEFFLSNRGLISNMDICVLMMVEVLVFVMIDIFSIPAEAIYLAAKFYTRFTVIL